MTALRALVRAIADTIDGWILDWHEDWYPIDPDRAFARCAACHDVWPCKAWSEAADRRYDRDVRRRGGVR